MRALIIEDNPNTSSSMALMLKTENFSCEIVASGQDGLGSNVGDCDIVLLDLDLPDMDGFDVLRRFRAAGITTPILMVSGLDGLDHKIKALTFGADDFLTKPFRKRELLARIHAIIRRASGEPAKVIRSGGFVVNIDTRTVQVDGKPMLLTDREFSLLVERLTGED
ncbi:MAG TPA: response regulator [Aliidongia sp.]|nr:response regulator [Aliidongia sp.]